MFRRLPDAGGAAVELLVDGTPRIARDGDTVAAALLAAGMLACRTTPATGAPRGPPASRLSQREREVVRLIAEGNSSKQIAARLSLALSTVETYRRNIADKLGVHSVADLTRYAIRNGLLSLE